MSNRFFSIVYVAVCVMVMSGGSRADLSLSERTHLQDYIGNNCPGLKGGPHENSIKSNMGRLVGALGEYNYSQAKIALEVFTHLTKKYAPAQLSKLRQQEVAFKLILLTISHFKRGLSVGKIMHYTKLNRILSHYSSLSDFYAHTHHLIFSNCIAQTHEDEVCLMTVKQYDALNVLMSVLQLLGEDLPNQCAIGKVRALDAESVSH